MSRREEAELAETLAARGEATETTLAGRSGPASSKVAAGDHIGRYELVALVGAGAMGEVWEAHDPQLDRKIAIKLVHPRVASSPEIAARMAREARAMAKVSHRAVVTVYDAGEANDQLFLAMELVRGRSLGAVLRGRSPDERADWKRWLQMLVEAGHGLAAAHEAGVLHRDFKPDNVLVDARGRVCVGDFGLASLGDGRARLSRPVLSTAVTDAELTATGTLLGTPAYMSREQMFGDAVDARADQFSFCVATYEALYGERPFVIPDDSPASLPALMEAIEKGTIRPAPPDSRVPKTVRAALLRGLAAAPADRWPTMNALLTELESALAPPEVTAPSLPARRRSYVALGALLALVVVGVVAFIVLRGRGRTEPSVVRSVPHDAAPAAPAARFVRNLGTRTIFAISPNGTRAFGTNRLDIEVPGESATRRYTVPPFQGVAPWAEYLQFEGDDILHWASRTLADAYTWNLRGNEPPVRRSVDKSVWLGRVLDGELLGKKQPDGSFELRYVRGEEVVGTWSSNTLVEVISVSPDRRRVAYVAAVDRTHARIVVLDIESGSRLQSDVLVALTALSWRTNDLLLYAADVPATIYEMKVTRDELGARRVLYEPHITWIGMLAANATTALYTDLNWTTRGRIVSMTMPPREFDPAQVASVLGWRDDTHFVAWNRVTHQLELRDPNIPGTPLSVELTGEPQNATLADGTLIVAMRGAAGRAVVAFDVDHGKQLWTKPEGELLAVRCAGDRATPCLAARRLPGDGERYALVPIDPATGELGTASRYEGELVDFALHPDGNRIALIPSATSQVVDVTGTTSRVRKTVVGIPRTIAFQPGGGTVIGGTAEQSRYVVRLENEGQPPKTLQAADSEMVVLVRPSSDGQMTLVMTRTFKYDLWELPLPPVAD